MRLSDRVHGHLATLGPFVGRRLRPPRRPKTVPWATEVDDSSVGTVRLSGQLLDLEGDELVVVVHGLGGSTDSSYMALALQAAEREGLSCLLLNTRGADQSGDDISHAGLIADLDATLEAPTLARFGRVYLFGYSLGGHLALRYAVESPDVRLCAVAAVSSPLDLEVAAATLDGPRVNVYRRHVMQGLRDIYAAYAQRRGGGLSVEAARAIDRIRVWDHEVVAPRFGFSSAEEYYRKVSVGPLLPELRVPALYVGALHDPMVLSEDVRASLGRASNALHVHWESRGGHLGFAPQLDLGQTAPLGLEDQVMAWLRHARGALGARKSTQP